jgi:diguanylate cyclase (GGDEF)-like protein/PAS domain S-box-containing protein
MLKQFSLLYIEEDETTSLAFLSEFEKFFKSVFIARSAEEGMSIFDVSRPDMVVTDIQLSSMDGLELIKHLRVIESKVPIIVNSAFSDPHLLLQSIALSVNDYILKPTNTNLMLQALRKAARVLSYEKSLARSHAMMQTIIDEIPDPIMYIELDMRVKMMNKAAKALGGERLQELYPKCNKISDETNGGCTNAHPCPINDIIKTKAPSTVRHVHTDKEGKTHHIDVHAKPIFDHDGAVVAYLEIRQDISAYLDVQKQLILETKKLTHLSMHDSLTQLPNRRLLEDRINHAIDQKNRSGGEFGILFIDIDHFKEINDSLGHLIGDQLLINIAKRIQKVIRKVDTLARNGGDEFVLIIDNGTSETHYSTIAEKILNLFKEPFHIGGYDIMSACSIGISMFPKDGESVETLLHHADTAMYTSKKAGRQQFNFYQSY